jgi:hypothetical protein
MTVLGGGVYRLQVESAPLVWSDVSDLTQATFGMRGGTSRTRVFRKTYTRSQRKEYTVTANGLFNDADAGQAALIAAEESDTPIRVRWWEDMVGGTSYKLMTVNVSSISDEAPADEFDTITFELTSAAAPVDTPLVAETLEELQSMVAAAGTAHLTHAIEAGRGHTLSAGNKSPITDVFGSSGLDLVARTGAGLIYDPVTGLLNPGGPTNGATPGTDSSQTAYTALLGHLLDVGTSKTFCFVFKAYSNPASTDWGFQRPSDNEAILHPDAPDAAGWVPVASSFGFNNSGSKGLLPYGDGLLHCVFVDFIRQAGTIVPTATAFWVFVTGERDLAALIGQIAGAVPNNEATNRLIIGQGGSFDAPGSRRWRDVLMFDGQLNDSQRDIVFAWARSKGAKDSTRPVVVCSGDTFVGGNNVATAGLFKRLLSDIPRADFVNLGSSAATPDMLRDRVPIVDAHSVSNARRPRRVVVYHAFNDAITGDPGNDALVLASVRAWCTLMRSKMQPGDKIVMTTPMAFSVDANWLNNRALIRTALLADVSGTYYDAVCDWGNPAWVWGTSAILSDASRIDVGGSFFPIQAGYDELAADATHGLVAVINPLIP